MKLNRKWLHEEFVDLSSVSDKEFVEKLTVFGQKVETYERMDAEIKNVVVGKASREVFEMINKELNEIVVGQEQAVRELTIAFRRPYVTGSNPSKIRNSIILTGSNGSGRHLLVKGMATLLKQHGLIVSDEIITIDMQRYQILKFVGSYIASIRLSRAGRSSS